MAQSTSARQLCMLSMLFALFVATDAVVEAGTVRLGAEWSEDAKEQLIGKFAYGIGVGTWVLKVRAPAHDVPIEVNLHTYVDERWEELSGHAPCGPKTLAKASTIKAVAGEWTEVRNTFTHRMRTHIWYFTLSSCGKGYNSTEALEFEWRSTQEDGSELGVEKSCMTHAIWFAFLLLTCLVVCVAVRCRLFFDSIEEVHPAVKALIVAVLLQLVSKGLLLIHLQRYEAKGIGQSSFDVAADTLFMLSQVTTSSLLIVMANGFCFLSSKCGEPAGAKSIAIVACIVLWHVAPVGCGKMLGDHLEQHHENDGHHGLVLVLVHIWLCLCFRSRISTFQQDNLRLGGLLQSFRFAGSAYFLAYPAVFAAAQFFAPYLRHPVMHLGLVVIQAGSSIWLSCLFLRRGRFFHLSALSCSLLPGGMDCGGGKLD